MLVKRRKKISAAERARRRFAEKVDVIKSEFKDIKKIEVSLVQEKRGIKAMADMAKAELKKPNPNNQVLFDAKTKVTKNRSDARKALAAVERARKTGSEAKLPVTDMVSVFVRLKRLEGRLNRRIRWYSSLLNELEGKRK